MSIGTCLTEWLMILLFQYFFVVHHFQQTFTYNLSTSAIHVVHHLAQCLSAPFTDIFINIYRSCNYRWLLRNWMDFLTCAHMVTHRKAHLWEDLSVRRYEGKWAWYVIKNVKSPSHCHSLSPMHTCNIFYIV